MHRTSFKTEYTSVSTAKSYECLTFKTELSLDFIALWLPLILVSIEDRRREEGKKERKGEREQGMNKETEGEREWALKECVMIPS